VLAAEADQEIARLDRTSGSAREEIEKSWYPVGVQLILYGFARPRDRRFADSPLEGDRLEPSLPLTRQSFDFYNGAMSTAQCYRLRDAFLCARSRPTRVIALLGGHDFWSNGIDLNAIEASADPAEESWQNINAIDASVMGVEDDPGHRIDAVSRKREHRAACSGVAAQSGNNEMAGGPENLDDQIVADTCAHRPADHLIGRERGQQRLGLRHSNA